MVAVTRKGAMNIKQESLLAARLNRQLLEVLIYRWLSDSL